MKRVLTLGLLVSGIWLGGCSSQSDSGTLPPAPKQMSEEEKKALPAPAAAGADAAAERGAAMAKAYNDRYKK